jgi:NAD(P)-dependent dehydrogenase (short-subunit alcohol dehydrogenase family)
MKSGVMVIPRISETVSLQGQVALVTGAGSGVGRMIAETLASAGAVIAAIDLTPMNVEAVVDAIRARGGAAKAYVEDLTRGMPVRDLIDRVVTDLGRLDILVNAAQVRHPASMLEMDEWDWQRTLDINLTGPFLLMQASAGHMQAQGGGVILNFAVDGISGSSISGRPAYYAGKSGLTALSRAAAQELLTYNIRIHVLCIDEVQLSTASDPEDSNLNKHELLSEIALLLCSPQTAQLTGHVFRLDGA